MLPPGFLARPFAHRALHGPGRPENSIAAVDAAIASGYGIEIDLQLSSDGRALVFHDYDLGRLTHETGAVRQRSAAELQTIALKGGDGRIPSFEAVLDRVAGWVPLLVEIKDQDGAMGSDVGALEDAAAAALRDYDGPVAVMSFNPHSVDALRHCAPSIPRGLTTCAFTAADWPTLDAATRDRLRGIGDFDRVGACFVSHAWRDLQNPAVLRLRQRGTPVLSWTIRSPDEDAAARLDADTVTFEGYAA